MYTPLLTYKRVEGEEGTELMPGLARDLPEISQDGWTYRLKLRKGLRYSDGRRVSDFEHTIKRMLTLESGGASFYRGIEGAQPYVERGKPKPTSPESRATTTPARSPSGSLPQTAPPERAGDELLGSRALRHSFREHDQGSAYGSWPLQVDEVRTEPGVRAGAEREVRPPRHTEGASRPNQPRRS